MYKNIFFVFLLLLMSCDSYQKVIGMVVDKNSGVPIQGVSVHDKNKGYHTTKTDSLGMFEVSKISGGLKPEPLILVIKMDGYVEQELTIPLKNRDLVKIYLVKK